MITKKQILQNVRSFSPQELADAVKNGVVSLYELNVGTNGEFTARMKRLVVEILEGKNVEREPMAADGNQPAVSRQTVFETPSLDKTFSFEAIPNASLTEDSFNIDRPSPKRFEKKQRRMFSHLFSFKGRCRRLEFFLTIVILSVLETIGYGFIQYRYNHADENLWPSVMNAWTLDMIVLTVIDLILCVIVFAQGAKRCHDFGRSGWYQLIPFYGFVMLFASSENEGNKYDLI